MYSVKKLAGEHAVIFQEGSQFLGPGGSGQTRQSARFRQTGEAVGNLGWGTEVETRAAEAEKQPV